MNGSDEMKHSDFDLQHQNKSTESKIVASLERIAQAFRVLLWQESKAFSLSPIQVQVLIFLLHHDRAQRKVSCLATEFDMTKATISDTVKTLEQKDLITKTSETSDTRIHIIDLTGKGREIAVQTSFFTEQFQVPIARLHPDDKENMLLGLMDIIRHLNKTGIIGVQRMCLACTYYRRMENGEKHFCNLLNQELQNNDLRIDCPEFSPSL